MVYRFRSVTVALLTFASFVTLTAGCATSFSPDSIRSEIVRQRSQNPRGVFELSLGRFTTLLLQSVLAIQENEELPLSGLSRIELAVYEAPAAEGPAIDVTRIPVRGWEPIVRIHDEARSGMVLVRGGGVLGRGAGDGSIGDLVVVGAGRNKIVYARLRGTLSGELPGDLGEMFRSGGPEEIRRVLSELTAAE